MSRRPTIQEIADTVKRLGGSLDLELKLHTTRPRGEIGIVKVNRTNTGRTEEYAYVGVDVGKE